MGIIFSNTTLLVGEFSRLHPTLCNVNVWRVELDLFLKVRKQANNHNKMKLYEWCKPPGHLWLFSHFYCFALWLLLLHILVSFQLFWKQASISVDVWPYWGCQLIEGFFCLIFEWNWYLCIPGLYLVWEELMSHLETTNIILTQQSVFFFCPFDVCQNLCSSL